MCRLLVIGIRPSFLQWRRPTSFFGGTATQNSVWRALEPATALVKILGGAQDGAANGVYLCMASPAQESRSALLLDEAHDDVFRWRLEQFLELGFSTEEAATLAESEADLAQARTVLGGGCTLAVAFRILL